ncbi:MAG TPA: dTDP-4-dehydrorhamnose reductase [Thermoanaerobaculia bacterium]|jgi:dTDP-4-dehydrorhamnose reductase|nr:dTDP-4-dehydrorhamnose reductase [Thermoanaerobaculia bacterium]
MRCLVFGGTGMLGQAVIAEARSRGWAALGLSRAQADIMDPGCLPGWADAFRPELVVNCAAFTKVDACETDPSQAFAVNGEAVANVAAVAARAGAALVHVSTDYVFEGTANEPYREDAPTRPCSVYGRSKLAGEAHALACDRGLVVRTSWLFGPGGPNFVATMVGLIEAGRVPLRVVRDQEGCPTYAPFLARALLDLAQGGVTGIVHYRNREPVSWYAFAAEIARLWSGAVEVVPVTTAEFPRPAPRPAYSVLDVTRFERSAGRSVEPWEWGLVEMLGHLRCLRRLRQEQELRKGRRG